MRSFIHSVLLFSDVIATVFIACDRQGSNIVRVRLGSLFCWRCWRKLLCWSMKQDIYSDCVLPFVNIRTMQSTVWRWTRMFSANWPTRPVCRMNQCDVAKNQCAKNPLFERIYFIV